MVKKWQREGDQSFTFCIFSWAYMLSFSLLLVLFFIRKRVSFAIYHFALFYLHSISVSIFFFHNLDRHIVHALQNPLYISLPIHGVSTPEIPGIHIYSLYIFYMYVQI